MVSIIIVDDHPIVRRGIRRIISSEDDMEILDEASSIDELFQKLQKAICQVIILDVRVKGENSFLAITDILKLYPSINILILTDKSEKAFAKKCFEAGVKGYFPKSSEIDELPKAIRKVSLGGMFTTASFTQFMLLSCLGQEQKPKIDALTSEEFNAMLLMASGQDMNEIAKRLKKSRKTIVAYKKRIMDKMEIQGMGELITYCIQNGLV